MIYGVRFEVCKIVFNSKGEASLDETIHIYNLQFRAKTEADALINMFNFNHRYGYHLVRVIEVKTVITECGEEEI